MYGGFLGYWLRGILKHIKCVTMDLYRILEGFIEYLAYTSVPWQLDT